MVMKMKLNSDTMIGYFSCATQTVNFCSCQKFVNKYRIPVIDTAYVYFLITIKGKEFLGFEKKIQIYKKSPYMGGVLNT